VRTTAIFLARPELKCLSKPVQRELKSLEAQLDALQSTSRRMTELSVVQTDEKEDRNEAYYQKKGEDARSFLSVYEQALTMVEQAKTKSSLAQTLLRQEKDAWIQVRESRESGWLHIGS